jgi:hypothetical protein
MATTLSYPATLPALQAQACQRSGLTQMLRTPMETGAPRVESEFTTTPRFLQAQTLLTQAQFDAFYDFFELDLQAGALSFYIAAPGPSYSSGIEWWEAAFAAPYRAQPQPGGRYLVTMALRLIGGPSATNPAA